ncbi:MAG: potassium transporter TrkA [Marinilabiliales bacterium]|nr:MAG: potassium transporter TrkA [Marinilabiliales bacterium]
MKFIIIGLGNFGVSLGEKLSRAGHEVIGVDKDITNVEANKEKLTHTICLDCKDVQATSILPLKNTDVVIVCIGEDEGANLMATASMKKMNVKRLIVRATSPLHENILEAMGIEEIIHPEEETANRWTKNITMNRVVDSFCLSDEYGLIEATVPEKFVGKTLVEARIKSEYEVVVLTKIKISESENSIGVKRKVKTVEGVASSTTVLDENDILVMYGKLSDIKRLLKND